MNDKKWCDCDVSNPTNHKCTLLEGDDLIGLTYCRHLEDGSASAPPFDEIQTTYDESHIMNNYIIGMNKENLVEEVMSHMENKGLWAQDFVNTFVDLYIAGEVDYMGEDASSIIAAAAEQAVAERIENAQNLPETGTIDAGVMSVAINDDTGQKALKLPLEDFTPLWDNDNCWGSKIYTDYDFSLDPKQSSVKVSFQFSTFDDDMINESMWVSLIETAFFDEETGLRVYLGILDNDPTCIDLDEMSPETIDDDTGGHFVLIAAEAIMCCFDHEAREAGDNSNMFRREGTIPSNLN